MPKTRQQIADEIGISVTTLWRRMREKGLSIPKGLVFTESENKIRALFQLPKISNSYLKENEKK